MVYIEPQVPGGEAWVPSVTPSAPHVEMASAAAPGARLYSRTFTPFQFSFKRILTKLAVCLGHHAGPTGLRQLREPLGALLCGGFSELRH